ncbi:MAG: DEAD/DEAH box helicase [Chitinophagaceae bacterium]|nr:MAG: DEAD/DEAH box helicase [Chitinophagaceae bacterium]
MSLQKLHPQLQKFVVNEWKGSGLTPIQEKAFDPVFEGKSCTVEAPTAGGKTEAVLFPLLTRLAANKSSGFRVLYIAPLKALLNDLELRVVKYSKLCYMEAFKWHGDVNQDEKREQFVFPSDILLTTPESLEAMLLKKADWVNAFRNLETIVIDEAHYFALTERGCHLISLLARLEAGIKRVPQRIAVTATVGNPGEMLQWLLGSNSEGVPLKESASLEKERKFEVMYFPEGGEQLRIKLYELLAGKKSIVFERSRTDTEDTATWINQRNFQLPSPKPVIVKTHHSSVSKRLREDAEGSIKATKEGSLNAIISTSTLELGIDIGDLDRVFQIGGLNSSGSFLQRVGRTGRRKDIPQYFKGMCVSPEALVQLTGCVSLGLKRISEKVIFPTRAFHILAHQVICLCLQKRGATAEQIWEILSPVGCFSGISREEFKEMVDYMIQEDFLHSDSAGVLLTSNKTESQFLRANWRRLFAVFESGPLYSVVDGKKVIGTLDSDFAKSQELPFIFVLGGYEWNAKKIDHELQQIQVVKNETGLAPEWSNISQYDIPFELAQEIGRLLMNDEVLPFLDIEASKIFEAERATFRNLEWNASKWVVDASGEHGEIYVWTFAGSKINRALAKLMSSGVPKAPIYTYEHVILKGTKNSPLEKSDIEQLLKYLKTLSLEEIDDKVLEKLKATKFSKFSDCLPESLNRSTLKDKSYDTISLHSLLREVSITM